MEKDGITMKLAEALSVRADINRQLQELRERIIRNATYQEGDTPAESPDQLLLESDVLFNDYMELVVRINRTNNSIKLDDGKEMVVALAERDVLKQRHSLYKSLATAATPQQDRYSKKEIKFISAVNVGAVQSKSDDIAKSLRKLDSLIQQANWTNDLI